MKTTPKKLGKAAVSVLKKPHEIRPKKSSNHRPILPQESQESAASATISHAHLPAIAKTRDRLVTNLKQHFADKVAQLTGQVTADRHWKLEDELMCQVFGFTLYGYACGIGRVQCFLDVADIDAAVVDQLASLGIGRKYATGLVEVARREFTTESSRSWQKQLVGIGHSHALKENMELLVNSVFTNTTAIRQATTRRWWKFWK